METMEELAVVEVEGSPSKCLLCLEPAESNQLAESPNLITSFVDLVTASETKNFWPFPKKLFTEGMIEASYCNKCYNQLHELNFLQNKIKTLQEFLAKLEKEIESGILEKYNTQGDSPGERDSKNVAELRQRFYKISVKTLSANHGSDEDPLRDDHYDDCLESNPDFYDETKPDVYSTSAFSANDFLQVTLHNDDRPSRTKRKPLKLRVPTVSRRGKAVAAAVKKVHLKDNTKDDKLKQRAVVKLERLEVFQKSVRRAKKLSKFKNTSHLAKSLNSLKPRPLGVSKRIKAPKSKNIPKNYFDCEYCGDRFYDRIELRSHANELHDDEKTQQCTHDGCEMKFFTKTEVKKHMRKHVEKLSCRCPVCQKCLPNELVLQAHMMGHTNEEKLPHYKCSLCGKKYTNLQLLNAHVRYIHELRERFVCQVCGKSFGTESYLAAHEVSHDTIGHHLCELCGKSYKHKKDLRLHDLKIHSIGINLKPHVCIICDRGFYRADHLRIHQVKENHFHGDQQMEMTNIARGAENDMDNTMLLEEFKCTICGKEFVSDLAMRTHLLTHAEVDGATLRLACPECDRRYQNPKSLEYHIKYMHKLKAMHKCNFCDKTFGRQSSLKRHQTVHDVSASFHCTECEKVYKNKIDVRNHFKREHLGESSFEHFCSQCNKKFYRKDMLRLHQVKSGHYAPGSLDSKSSSTQIIVVETSEVPLMGSRLEVIEDDEEIEMMGVGEVIDGIPETDADAEPETQEIETQELETQEIDEGALDTELNMFIQSMH